MEILFSLLLSPVFLRDIAGQEHIPFRKFLFSPYAGGGGRERRGSFQGPVHRVQPEGSSAVGFLPYVSCTAGQEERCPRRAGIMLRRSSLSCSMDPNGMWLRAAWRLAGLDKLGLFPSIQETFHLEGSVTRKTSQKPIMSHSLGILEADSFWAGHQGQTHELERAEGFIWSQEVECRPHVPEDSLLPGRGSELCLHACRLSRISWMGCEDGQAPAASWSCSPI